MGIPTLDERDPSSLAVRNVTWYPEGPDEDGDDREPFVYIVIGPHQRS